MSATASSAGALQPCLEGVLKQLHALVQGADFIECDVVLTKDCQPICRHEPDISHTTDALMKFPTQQKNRTIDGVAHLVGDWCKSETSTT